ncbi:carboxypeptidase B-like [Actinia tenebrosa]|uniref:Carboxypeptidase B-like n=1 Tax=Actinia tenebrosa TaxID=6105 RepID=A0A6P8HVA1_ACTTE|nr:carboxypeptidase B-like [Actinia tenebrosa]
MAALKLAVAVVMTVVAIGYGGKYTGDKILRIIPTSRQDIKILTELEEAQPIKLDFWKYPDNVGKPVDIHVQSQDFANFTEIMQNIGIKFKVLAADLQVLMDQQNDIVHYADEHSHWFVRYHPLKEIEAKIRHLVNKADERAELIPIGKSFEKRDQLAVKIKGAPQNNKPVMFINCGIHAREWVAPATCIYMLEQFVNEYNTDATIKATLDKMDFIILPVFNPDGYVYSWTNDRLWRKNRRPTSNPKCVGTDLNRNFPFQWGSDSGSSSLPCSEIYRGDGPMSEVEVRNVVEYLKALVPHVKGYLDIHSYSQLWMLPWGYKKQVTQDHVELAQVAKVAVQAIKTAGFNTEYQTGLSSNLLYRTSGSTKDFTYGTLHIKYSYVLELRDNGNHGFLLPQSQILPTAMETFAGIKAMVASMDLTQG